MKSITVSFTAVSLLLAISGCQPGSESTPPDSSSALPATMTFVESVEKKVGDEIVIPYKKYFMDNGLTVILHEDRSDPLVHVDVTYHVGSGREEIGKSGFAHFFEHKWGGAIRVVNPNILTHNLLRPESIRGFLESLINSWTRLFLPKYPTAVLRILRTASSTSIRAVNLNILTLHLLRP